MAPMRLGALRLAALYLVLRPSKTGSMWSELGWKHSVPLVPVVPVGQAQCTSPHHLT